MFKMMCDMAKQQNEITKQTDDFQITSLDIFCSYAKCGSAFANVGLSPASAGIPDPKGKNLEQVKNANIVHLCAFPKLKYKCKSGKRKSLFFESWLQQKITR